MDGTDRDAVRCGSVRAIVSCAFGVWTLGLVQSILYDGQTNVKAAAFACLYSLRLKKKKSYRDSHTPPWRSALVDVM